jgi:pimeloyl-ACP methyl ester carboxylesterase
MRSASRRLPSYVAAIVLVASFLVATDHSVANADDCVAPATQGQSASQRPVVFVHGWTDNSKVFATTGSMLQQQTNNQIKPYYFDYARYSTTWAGADTVAGCLATYINTVSTSYGHAGGDGKVIVVAHSMGGLATLYASGQSKAGSNVGGEIGGVITFDTPYTGSPFGDTGIAAEAEKIKGHGAITPQAGSDAQVCLGTHANGMPLPTGCGYGLPPFLPVATPITQIAGSITVRRMFAGVHLYDIALGSDGIVPVGSSQGYLNSRVQSQWPLGEQVRSATDACTVDSDTVLTGVAAAGLSGSPLAGFAAGVAQLFADKSAFDGLQSGHLTPGLAVYLGAVTLVAGCSHIHVVDDPTARSLAVQAVQNDLASLGPVTEQELLSAPVPSLRGEPAGHLVNGQLPNAGNGAVGLETTGGAAPAFGDMTGDGVGDAAAVLSATSGAGGGDEYVELYTDGADLTRLAELDPVAAAGHVDGHAFVLAMVVRGGDVLIDWETEQTGLGVYRFWSARLHWNGHSIQIGDLAEHTGITGSQLWSDPQLTITPTSLGRVKIGMSQAQAEAAAGFSFGVGGDGYVYPDVGPTGGAHLYVAAGPGFPVRCVGAEDGVGVQTVTTPEGVKIGDPASKVTAVYGARATYVPAPSDGGMSPHDGYVVREGDGALAFMLDDQTNTVAGIAGGPSGLTPSSCTG